MAPWVQEQITLSEFFQKRTPWGEALYQLPHGGLVRSPPPCFDLFWRDVKGSAGLYEMKSPKRADVDYDSFFVVKFKKGHVPTLADFDNGHVVHSVGRKISHRADAERAWSPGSYNRLVHTCGVHLLAHQLSADTWGISSWGCVFPYMELLNTYNDFPVQLKFVRGVEANVERVIYTCTLLYGPTIGRRMLATRDRGGVAFTYSGLVWDAKEGFAERPTPEPGAIVFENGDGIVKFFADSRMAIEKAPLGAEEDKDADVCLKNPYLSREPKKSWWPF